MLVSCSRPIFICHFLRLFCLAAWRQPSWDFLSVCRRCVCRVIISRLRRWDLVRSSVLSLWISSMSVVQPVLPVFRIRRRSPGYSWSCCLLYSSSRISWIRHMDAPASLFGKMRLPRKPWASIRQSIRSWPLPLARGLPAWRAACSHIAFISSIRPPLLLCSRSIIWSWLSWVDWVRLPVRLPVLSWWRSSRQLWRAGRSSVWLFMHWCWFCWCFIVHRASLAIWRLRILAFSSGSREGVNNGRGIAQSGACFQDVRRP